MKGNILLLVTFYVSTALVLGNGVGHTLCVPEVQMVIINFE